MNMRHLLCAVAFFACTLVRQDLIAQTASTVFTYQGELNQSGQAVDSTIPMSFRLFDSSVGGAQVGSTVTMAGVDVVDGLFQVGLDFGAVATGTTGLWLEIQVDGFVMNPREAITASPYSLQTRGIHVNSAGDVGIGTDVPDADVEVREDDASIRVRSTNGVNTARVELMGMLPSPAGGVFSSLRFLDSLGGARFGIQHDSAFFTEYLTLTTPDHPSGLVRISEDGLISIDDVPSIATVHVTDRDIGVYNDGMLNETLALEDNDAVLGIYSSNTGSFGSALVFGESTGNALNDKWGMVRTTTNTDPELRVTYGTDTNYAQNPTALAFVPGGIKYSDGSVQTTAARGLNGSWDLSLDAGLFGGPSIPDEPAYLFHAVRTANVSSPDAAVLVVGTMYATIAGDAVIRYRLAYRPAGSSVVPTPMTVSHYGYPPSGALLNGNFSANSVVTGLAPGTYEFGFWVQVLASTPGTNANFAGNDLSILVFE